MLHGDKDRACLSVWQSSSVCQWDRKCRFWLPLGNVPNMKTNIHYLRLCVWKRQTKNTYDLRELYAFMLDNNSGCATSALHTICVMFYVSMFDSNSGCATSAFHTICVMFYVSMFDSNSRCATSALHTICVMFYALMFDSSSGCASSALHTICIMFYGFMLVTAEVDVLVLRLTQFLYFCTSSLAFSAWKSLANVCATRRGNTMVASA